MSKFEHDELVVSIAKQYEEADYNVYFEPEQNSAIYPHFLKELKYIPDLIAIKDDDNIIIEVKHRRNLINNSLMIKLSELVNSKDGWRFELRVYNNSDLNKIDSNKEKNIDKREILSNIEDIKKLVSMNFLKPAFLMSWALLEAAARIKLEKEEVIFKNTNLLFKQLYSKGHLNYNYFKFINKTQDIRHKIVHGLDIEDDKITKDILEKINKIIKYLLELDSTSKYIDWIDKLNIEIDTLKKIFFLYSSLRDKNDNTFFSTSTKNSITQVKDKKTNTFFTFPKEEIKEILDITKEEFISSAEQKKQWNQLKKEYDA